VHIYSTIIVLPNSANIDGIGLSLPRTLMQLLVAYMLVSKKNLIHL